jgi:elongator complex protein 1
MAGITEADWAVPNLEIIAELASKPQAISISHESALIIALSSLGKLLVASTSGTSQTITVASGVTSFVLSPDFLIYSTSAHHSHYASLPVLSRMIAGEDVATHETEWETRRLERGSILISASPSEMSLVMQMPRGNLETVFPRPLVLSVVRREVLR